MNTPILDEVVEHLKVMPQDLQLQVLEFIRSLTEPKIKGVSGQQLLRFAGAISADDIQLMREAIENDCGQVEINEW